MKRVFGKKKDTGPAPSLSEAGGRVDERVAKIEEKVSPRRLEVYLYAMGMLGACFGCLIDWLGSSDPRFHEDSFDCRHA